MNEQQIRTFLTAAELGSLTKAAEALSMTPQAAKGQVDVIERELGLKLFVRTNRGVSLTPAGEKFADLARDLVRAWDVFRTGARRLREGGPVLNLYMWPDVEMPLIEGICAAFLAQNPSAALNYVMARRTGYFDEVREGLADVAFYSEDAVFSKDPALRFRPFDNLTMRYTVLVSTGHPLAERPLIRPCDLAPYATWVTGSGIPKKLQIIEGIGLVPHERHAIMNAVSSNGACIVCDSCVVRVPGTVSVPLDVAPERVGLVTRPETDPLVERFAAATAVYRADSA